MSDSTRRLKLDEAATAPAPMTGRASAASRASVSARGPRLDPIAEDRLLQAHRGRGALSNRDGRFEPYAHEPVVDDAVQGCTNAASAGRAGAAGWGSLDEELPPFKTTVSVDATRTIIARNDSPDIPFAQSINPYRGCEHGCIYCYARPSHAYLGLSPGLDFETRLVAKPRAARLLEQELRHPGYRVSPIALGSNTDPYQPIERKLRITRQILEVLAAHEHPLTIVTKSALVERDLDLLAPMAEKNLCAVFVSVTTLDSDLARRLEPRAAAPHRRLRTIQALAGAGIPTGAMFAPAIPALNDHEMEAVLEAARARRRAPRRLDAAAPAIRNKGPFQGMARGPRSRPRRARVVAHPPESWRTGKRPALRPSLSRRR